MPDNLLISGQGGRFYDLPSWTNPVPRRPDVFFPDFTTFPNQIPVFGTPPFNPNAPIGTTSPTSGGNSGGGGGSTFQWLPPLLAVGAGIGGALSNTKGARTGTSTSMPLIPPAYQTLNDLLRARAEQRLNSTTDLSGLEATGIDNINETFRGIGLADDASLTSRGLGTSPVAATVGTNRNLARGGQIAQFRNTLPLILRQFENEDFARAAGLVAQNTGTTGTNVQPGSALGSGIDSAAKMLAFMKGQGVI